MQKLKAITIFTLLSIFCLNQSLFAKDEWYSTHMTCGKEKPKNINSSTKGYAYTSITFNLNNKGLVQKLIIERDGDQYPNFESFKSFQSYIRNAGIFYSKIIRQDNTNLVIQTITEYPEKFYISEYKINRQLGIYEVSYSSRYKNGNIIKHTNETGICWIDYPHLF